MQHFAVAWIGFFDNDLTIEFTYAKDWRDAVATLVPELSVGDMEGMDLEDVKQFCFDMDMMVDVEVVV